MPLHKEKNHSLRNALIIGAIIILLVLMIISFSPDANVTEVVLYP